MPGRRGLQVHFLSTLDFEQIMDHHLCQLFDPWVCHVLSVPYRCLLLSRTIPNRVLIVVLNLLSIHSFYGSGDLCSTMGFASYQGTIYTFHFLSARAHNLAAYIVASCVVEHIQLVEFSTDDTSVHFTFCLCFRHNSPPIK